MSKIVLYFLHSTSALLFHMDSASTRYTRASFVVSSHICLLLLLDNFRLLVKQLTGNVKVIFYGNILNSFSVESTTFHFQIP